MKKTFTLLLFFILSYMGTIASGSSTMALKLSNPDTVDLVDPMFSGQLLFTGRMTADQEVPPSGSEFEGVFGLLLNEDRNSAYITMAVNGLEGQFTGVHLHNAPAGANGGVVYNLTDLFDRNRISAEIPIDGELLRALMAGEIYVNLHSTDFPDGALRAQLNLEKDLSYAGILEGSNEVPAVNTDAQGFAALHLTQVLHTAEINVIVTDLSGPITGAHLHMAAEGENGGVVVDLTDLVQGNCINGNIDASNIVDALNNEMIYINIHTDANPAGEIRAQLFPIDGLMFDTPLSGSLEVPATNTSAYGFAAANFVMDEGISVYAVVNDLSSPITGAHLHGAGLEETGPVLVDLSMGIDSNIIDIESMFIDSATLDALLTGDVYLNVHTDSFPNGEVRGQLYGLFRDAYAFDLCAEQETDPVTGASQASGGGILSLDRKGSNVHLMAVTTETTDTLTGLHIHEGDIGEAGPVILGLTDQVQNGSVFLYYSDSTFMRDVTPAIKSGNAYLNAHTDANPAGELRGQIVRNALCPRRFEIPQFDITDPGFSDDILITSRLTGSNEVPPVVTPAVGVATINFNETMTRGTINMTVSGLTGEFTGVHIHEGGAGENGPVVVNLTDDYSNGRLTAEFDVDNNLLNRLITGNAYLNVHTNINPAGEIRGQLTLEAPNSYTGVITGDKEVPAVDTEASGLISMHLTPVTNELEINVLATQLSGPIVGIHLHKAAAGENGPVVEDLTPYLNGNTISTKIMAGDYIEALNSDSIYINIHTQDNPAGEIRAQLRRSNTLFVDSWLSNDQEMPLPDAYSYGFAIFEINPTLDMMDYYILTDNIVSPITGTHLHEGVLGVNGPVVVNLSDGIEDNVISGTSVLLDRTVVQSLLSGSIYVNVHSENNPAGEIRGQLYRLAREGFAYDLCQEQEVTEVTNAGDASGSGMFAYNRDKDEAHLMIVVNELSSEFRGAHIHNAEAGVDGPVIFNITPAFNNNGAFLYFTAADTTAFDNVFADIISSGNAYVNVHTANNPAGEVRGQIVKTPNCPFTSAIIEVDDSFIEINTYPNPIIDQIYFESSGLEINQVYNIEASLLDQQGRLILQKRDINLSNGLYVGQLDPGMYFLRLSNKDFTHTFKLVKNN